MTTTEWLRQECPETDLRYLKPETKEGAYIPIGIVEEKLDEHMENWGTSDSKFVIYRAGNTWLASGSIVLKVQYDGKERSLNGAATFQISSKDANQDFEATTLSFCISNAAKKLGKAFGRHLNGRLDIGEVLPFIDRDYERRLDAAVDKVNAAKNIDELTKVFDENEAFGSEKDFLQAVLDKRKALSLLDNHKTKQNEPVQ